MHKNKGFNMVLPRLYLIFQTIGRLCLFLYALWNNQVELLELPSIMTVGFVNDSISLAYCLPVILLLQTGFIFVSKKFNYSLMTPAVLGYFVLVNALIFNLVSEIVFWDEFGTRFNFIAVDYLIYTQEIVGTITESMPIIPMIVGIILVSCVITLYSLRYLYDQVKNVSYSRDIKTIFISCLLAIVAFNFYDSEKFTLSGNIYAQELGKNGPYEFVSAYRNNALNYLKFYPTIDAKEAEQLVRDTILQPNQKFMTDDGVERETHSHKLHEEVTNPTESKQPNIVLITVESLSAEYMTAFGSQDDITPNLDRLAKESVFFTNLYAAGTRTVRGLEAISLGAPPTPGSSIIRRTNNHDLFNIATPLKDHGYEATFLFGGFSYFDNLDDYFSGNGYKVIDRSSLDSAEITFSNIWGIADEDLLARTMREADQSYEAGRPFFSFVMTTNNHRPYTFPEGKIDRPSGSGRLAAVKYTDYAIGKFIEDARSKPWFDNTIFIVTADHCASSAGKTHLPVY